MDELLTIHHALHSNSNVVYIGHNVIPIHYGKDGRRYAFFNNWTLIASKPPPLLHTLILSSGADAGHIIEDTIHLLGDGDE